MWVGGGASVLLIRAPVSNLATKVAASLLAPEARHAVRNLTQQRKGKGGAAVTVTVGGDDS